MVRENVVVGEGTDFPLNGLLTIPDSPDGPVPAVVFVHGSGSTNMDEKVYALTPFKDLAEGLAERGIASLRYDKRSFAHGRRMRKQLITVKEETIDDALLATELLRRDPRMDGDALFIVGHSMGAMLAPRIDAEGGNYCGLILMAGSPRRLEEVMVRQFDQAKHTSSLTVRALAGLEDRIFSKKFDGLYELSDEEAKRRKFAGGTTLYYFKEAGAKTTTDYLLESDKPVLIMQGGMDIQATVEDFAGFQELLRGRDNVEYRLYDELNHLFVKGSSLDFAKGAKDYKKEQHIGAEVMDDIAAFVRASIEKE